MRFTLNLDAIRTSNVNHDARKERHHKLFGKNRARFARIKQLRGRMKRCADNARKGFSHPLHGHSPAQQLFRRVVVFSLVLFSAHSFNTADAYDTGGTYDYYDKLEISSANLDLVADQEGYLTKVTAWDGVGRYLNRGDQDTVHTVMPGDTLSMIAYRYDLNMETILTDNPDLGGGDHLSLGEEITIAPADGYRAKSKGGTLEALFEKYYEGTDEDRDVSWERTVAINTDWDGDQNVPSGEKVFIVGGEEPYVPPPTRSNTSVRANDTRVYTASAPNTSPVSAGGYWGVRPTSGVITQYYRSGHYAIDIAGPLNTTNFSVGPGTVIKAQGGYNGGYGTVVIVDHGQTAWGSCQSLYAHNNELYVNVGDSVYAGQPLGGQGATGRVWGRTGIHLHFEWVCNGVKQNPIGFFQ